MPLQRTHACLAQATLPGVARHRRGGPLAGIRGRSGSRRLAGIRYARVLSEPLRRPLRPGPASGGHRGSLDLSAAPTRCRGPCRGGREAVGVARGARARRAFCARPPTRLRRGGVTFWPAFASAPVPTFRSWISSAMPARHPSWRASAPWRCSLERVRRLPVRERVLHAPEHRLVTRTEVVDLDVHLELETFRAIA